MNGKLLLASLLLTCSGFAAEEKSCPEDKCGLREEEQVIVEKNKKEVCRIKYRCPSCQRHFYYYEERDIDATWPSKQEDSFRESLTR